MWRVDSLEKTLKLGKIEGKRGKGGCRGWNDSIASATQWTWIWTTSRREWRIEEPGMLHSPLSFSCSVLSDSLWPHGLQHIRLPCSSLSPRVCSNSCPLSQWCLPAICHPLLLLPSIFPSIRDFASESALCIRWPKYWSFSFSISPSNEYSGLISFRINWFDLLAVQGTLKSSSVPQFESINSSAPSFLYGPTLTFVHD